MLLAVCQEVQIEKQVDSRVASCFGGGIGNTGSVCGAVIGAVMAIGLAKEQGETMEEMLGTLSVVQEFRRRFEAEMGSIDCHELTKADLTTPEGIEKFMASDIPQSVCFPAVETAYRLAVEQLREPK